MCLYILLVFASDCHSEKSPITHTSKDKQNCVWSVNGMIFDVVDPKILFVLFCTILHVECCTIYVTTALGVKKNSR
jgi:hypothetical protein